MISKDTFKMKQPLQVGLCVLKVYSMKQKRPPCADYYLVASSDDYGSFVDVGYWNGTYWYLTNNQSWDSVNRVIAWAEIPSATELTKELGEN